MVFSSAVLLHALYQTSLCAQSFQNPQRIPTNADPINIYVADVNGDGVPDILYEDWSGDPRVVRALLGQRNGGYAEGPTLSLPSGVSLCRPIDANHDGKIDLVCINIIDTFDVSIATFLGNGDGTYQAPIYSAPMQSNIAADIGFTPCIFTPADVNSDGNPDLLVGDANDHWTFVLLGDGTGQFKVASKIIYDASNSSSDFYVKDLNGDGKPDLVSYEGPFVWLGNGDGAFQDVHQYGLNVSCIFRDMDGDGHPDAICGQLGTTPGAPSQANGSMVLNILHGNTDGSFNTTPIASQTFGDPTGGYGKFWTPSAIYDINGDGIVDILAYSADGLSVLIGQAGLRYSDPVHYAVGYLASGGEQSSKFYDLNNDGAIDVVAAGPNGVYISYGNKDGTFAAPPTYEVADVVGNIVVADFNGDGIPDIVANGDTNLKLSLGNGDGTFKAPVAVPNDGIDFSMNNLLGTSNLLHGDFNGDGRQDLISYGSPTPLTWGYYIMFGNGDGTFTSPQLIPGSAEFNSFPGVPVVYDINKDGKDDVMTLGNGTLDFEISNGDGTFTTVSTPLPTEENWLGPSAKYPALADFDLDGKTDAVFGLGTTLYILKGLGNGEFSKTNTVMPMPAFQGYAPQYIAALTTGDFDGDGKPDIAALVQFDPSAVGNGYGPPWWTFETVAFVYYGNGDGTFSSPVVAGVFDRPYSVLESADLNKDGLSDLVLQTKGVVGPVYAPSGDSVGVVLAEYGRMFSQEYNYTAGNVEEDLDVADLNRDGLPDLIANNSYYFPDGSGSNPGGGATVLLNLGSSKSGSTSTTTKLASSKPTITVGAAVTLMATVTGSASGPAPTGSVRFADQTGVESTVALEPATLSSSSATFTSSAFGIGNDNVSATYSGDTEYAPSTAQLSETVNGYADTISFTASPNPGAAKGPIALNVAVANSSGSPVADPLGYVQIADGNTIISGPDPVSGGTVGTSIILAVPGTHTLTAWYSGDAIHNQNSANIVEQVVATPTVTATLSLPSVTTAQALSVAISISYNHGNITPTGTVSVSGGGFTSSAATLVGGNATIVIPAGSLAVGSDTLTIAYTPDAASSSLYTNASSTASIIVSSVESFSLNGTAVTVAAGATTGNSSNITITPSGGFTGSLTLTAKITSAPAGAIDQPTFSFSPSGLVSITGTSAGTTSLIVSTTAPSTAALRIGSGFGAGCAALALLLVAIPRRRRFWSALVVLLLLPVGLLTLQACGGGSGGGIGMTISGTTPGAYSVTVTGTSAGMTEMTVIQLNVH